MFNFLVSPYGRISRKTYWLRWILPYLVVSLVAVGLDFAAFPIDPNSGEPPPVFQSLLALLALWPSIAVTTRRLHDRGMTGWWNVAPFLGVMVLAIAAYWYYGARMAAGAVSAPDEADPVRAIVAVVGFAVMAWLILYPTINVLFLRGQTGANQYGDDPLGHPVGDTFT